MQRMMNESDPLLLFDNIKKIKEVIGILKAATPIIPNVTKNRFKFAALTFSSLTYIAAIFGYSYYIGDKFSQATEATREKMDLANFYYNTSSVFYNGTQNCYRIEGNHTLDCAFPPDHFNQSICQDSWMQYCALPKDAVLGYTRGFCMNAAYEFFPVLLPAVGSAMWARYNWKMYEMALHEKRKLSACVFDETQIKKINEVIERLDIHVVSETNILDFIALLEKKLATLQPKQATCWGRLFNWRMKNEAEVKTLELESTRVLK